MRVPETRTGPNIAELLEPANKPAEEVLRLHPVYRGKLTATPKCAINTYEDFSVCYSPENKVKY